MAKKKAAQTKVPSTDIFGRKVDREQFERHLALVRELGLTTHDLAEEVNTQFEHNADTVNDENHGGGVESQLAFLLCESLGLGLDEDLRNLAEFKNPPAPAPKKATTPAKKAAKKKG